MPRHKMRMRSSVTYSAHGCGECDWCVTKVQRDEGLDPMALIEAHTDATGHIVVVEDVTRRNYDSRKHPRSRGVNVVSTREG